MAAREIPLYAGPKRTSKSGMREEVRIVAKAEEVVERREPV
jgi:hypothetical protein